MGLSQRQIEEFWEIADKDKNGKLTISEIEQAIKKYTSNPPSGSKLAGMFCDLDTDNDNRISLAEFKAQMSKNRGAQLMQLWKKYDKDNNGYLERREIIDLLQDFYPPDKKDEILGTLLMYSDLNNDKRITKSEFEEFFCD